MSDEQDDRYYFFATNPDKTILSKSFTNRISGEKLRIASRIIEGEPGLEFATVLGETVLRQTRGGRYQIKATFLEDGRGITVLTIQRYSSKTGPLHRDYFSFVGPEVKALLDFIIGIRSAPLADSEKVHLTDDMLREIILNQSQARSIFEKNEALFLEIAQSDVLRRDLIAVGYRRKQLQYFESLLNEPAYFESEHKRIGGNPEAVWQKFFEANTWIFGYGLSFQFLSPLDDKKLEQVVRGADVTGSGKRSDGLMKTRGLINSLCFIEIKRHNTELLASTPFRPGAWPPSDDLVKGVVQSQATVQDAKERIGRRLRTTDDLSNPTGEDPFNIEPRSCLIIGSLAEFHSDKGINEYKFRSFESYRRNTSRPEILTFDELLHRARFIVEHGDEMTNAD